jgi:outer membrane protein assembly factor BamB
MLRIRGSVVCAVILAALVFVAGAQAVVAGSKPVLASWQTNGRVETIVISGSTAYLGGEFTSVRPSGDAVGTGEVARNHAAAVNVETGALLPWNPNANNTVQTIAVNGATVYLGGTFGTVGGKTHTRIAAVDATTGAPVQTFKGKANAEVMSLAVGATGLYAGGSFTLMDNVAHNYLAEVDLSTGALVTGWTGSAGAKVNAIALTTDGSRLVVGGTFATLDGVTQREIGALSPATGALLGWTTHPSFPITTLAVDASGVYAAGTGAGGNVVAYVPSTGAQLWNAALDGNDQAIAVDSGNVYVGGHFNNYCGPGTGTGGCAAPVARDHLLALNETNGTLLPWHPAANGVLGVFALAGGDGTLESGGDFTKIGGATQQGFAEFPEISLPTVTDSAGGVPTSTTPVTVTASGSTDTAPGFGGYKYETSTDNGTTWSALRTGATATVKAVGVTMVRFETIDAYGNTSGWVTDTVTIT